MLDYKVTQEKAYTLITVKGRMDGMTAPSIEDALKQNMDADIYRVVMDMTEVEFMSSAGWWVLIEAQKRAKKQNGELVFVNVNEKIRTSLNLVGMDAYFKLFDNIPAAAAVFS